jgi:hypothetical protein
MRTNILTLYCEAHIINANQNLDINLNIKY